MRKELARELRREFKRRMAEELPQFAKVKSDYPGDDRYVWRPSDKVSVFVELSLNPKDDAFTIEVGWSEKHEFPGSLRQIGSWLRDDPTRGTVASPVVDGGLRFGIGLFLDAPQDLWWDLITGKAGEFYWHPQRPLPLDTRIPGAVEDAISLLKSRALPYVLNRTAPPQGDL